MSRQCFSYGGNDGYDPEPSQLRDQTMKLPTIKMPAWWGVWHSFAVQLIAAVFNVYSAMTASTSVGMASGWFCAGVMVSAMPFTILVHRIFTSNDRLLHLAKEQQSLMNEIGQIKAEEIAAHVAAEMRGHHAELPQPPTRH